MSAISTTYAGFPVLIHTDDDLGQLNLPVSKTILNIGNEFETIGKAWQKRDNVKRKYYNRRIKQTYIVDSPDQITDFTDFFVDREGRYKQFFAPTWVLSLTPCETVSSSATLKVNQADRDEFYSSYNIVRKDVIIFENNLGSTGQYRKIASVTRGLDSGVSYDTITFDSAVNANPNSLITEIMWTFFGSDELTVTSIGNGRYRLTITLDEFQGGISL